MDVFFLPEAILFFLRTAGTIQLKIYLLLIINHLKSILRTKTWKKDVKRGLHKLDFPLVQTVFC